MKFDFKLLLNMIFYQAHSSRLTLGANRRRNIVTIVYAMDLCRYDFSKN